MASVRERRLVTVDDIRNGIRDAAFEGKILSRYGNYDNTSSTSKHRFMHCDLIDTTGFATVTLSIHKDHIKDNEEKMKVGNVLRVENFGVSEKTKAGHEKGDCNCVMKVLSATLVMVLEGSPNVYVPQFYHNESIQEFRKRSHEQYSSATIAVCVTDIHGYKDKSYGALYFCSIADGVTSADQDMLAFTSQFEKEFKQISDAYNNGLCVSMLLKNISMTMAGDRYFITKAFTIVTNVVHDHTKSHLQKVYETMKRNSTQSYKEVRFYS